MWCWFQLLYQRRIFELICTLARDSGADLHVWNGIEILSEEPEYSRIIESLEWLGGCAPGTRGLVCQHLKMIACFPKGDSTVFPAIGKSLVNSRELGCLDVSQLAHRLAGMARYIGQCKQTNRYKTYRFTDFPIFGS
jgi:hypothetical protein